MGACASKFTVLKNAAAAAPPPDVKQEVESREVNLVEEVAVNKDDAPAVEDDANRRQSLGHLLKENEGKKGSAEDVKQDDVAEVKPVAVGDVARDESEKAPIAEGLKAEACKNVEAEKVDEKPAETVKVETAEKVETLKTEEPEENKAVEIPCTDKEPATLEVEKTEVQKPASDEELKKEEKTAEKTPEAQESEKTDVGKKETDEKSTETGEIEISEKKSESPETEKTEEKKQAENTKIETSDKVDDKHVLEPLKTENCSSNETLEKGSEEQKPVSDAEKPKAEEVKANN
ncbi:hypothetical protein C2S52_021286 [Perilla frutescens var. hirtella]|nr:hypothetical protein C2S52_021286 [Perilla frutescens var. hirtella]